MSWLYLIQVSSEWYDYFDRTVAEPVTIEGESVPEELDNYREVRIWGSTETSIKRSHFDKMEKNDIVLFLKEGEFIAGARIDDTFVSSEVGNWAWNNPDSTLIFTLKNYKDISVSLVELWDLLGYKPNNRLQKSLVRVSENAMSNLLTNYNSLEEAYQDFTGGEAEPITSEQETTVDESSSEDSSTRIHTEVQYYLIKLGLNHNYDVYVAKNDQNLTYDGERLGEECVDELNLPGFSDATMNIIEYIDVIWIDGDYIVKMFEIESSTSIYSGILRMTDFVVKVPNLAVDMNIVAPASDETQVRKQINRPTFKNVLATSEHRSIDFISFEEVEKTYRLVEEAGPLQEVF